MNHDQIQTVIRATRSSENLWINTGNAPLDNVRIRQAIATGFDSEAGIKVTLSGYGSVVLGLGLMPTGSPRRCQRSRPAGFPAGANPAISGTLYCLIDCGNVTTATHFPGLPDRF